MLSQITVSKIWRVIYWLIALLVSFCFTINFPKFYLFAFSFIICLAIFLALFVVLSSSAHRIGKIILVIVLTFILLFTLGLLRIGGDFISSIVNWEKRGHHVRKNIITHTIKDYNYPWIPWYTSEIPEREANDFLWKDCMASFNNNLINCALLSPTHLLTANTTLGAPPLEVTYTVTYVDPAQKNNRSRLYLSFGDDNDIEITCLAWNSNKSQCIKTNELKHTYTKIGSYTAEYFIAENTTTHSKDYLDFAHIEATTTRTVR